MKKLLFLFIISLISLSSFSQSKIQWKQIQQGRLSGEIPLTDTSHNGNWINFDSLISLTSLKASNGLQVDSDNGNVIVGYNNDTPNVYRSIEWLLGNHFFNINADSTYAYSGETIYNGPYFSIGVAPDSSVYSGSVLLGSNDSVNFSELYINDNSLTFFSVLQNESVPFFDVTPISLDMEMGDGFTGFGIDGIAGSGYFNSGGLTILTDVPGSQPESRSVGQLTYIDNLNTVYVSHINGGADSISGYDAYPTLTVDENLAASVNQVSGNDISFTVHIKTGSVEPTTDTVIFKVHLEAASANSFNVVSGASVNSTSTNVFYALKPYTVVVDNQDFDFCAGASGGIGSNFASNTDYYFTFLLIDATSGYH